MSFFCIRWSWEFIKGGRGMVLLFLGIEVFYLGFTVRFEGSWVFGREVGGVCIIGIFKI